MSCKVSTSPNTGYTAHFVRPNRLLSISHSPIPLDEIAQKIELRGKQ